MKRHRFLIEIRGEHADIRMWNRPGRGQQVRDQETY
jgi:hypothetical protein